MAKSLGQIHTINQTKLVPVATGSNTKYLVDLAGELSSQLQTMVRQGNYFKVVGIDLTVEEQGGSGGGGSISGELRYYAPTRGRCQAYKNAYHAVRRGMELQGINIRGNRNYDFRVPVTPIGDYIDGADFLNQATIDGTNGLCLTGASQNNDDIFEVYNRNIQPTQGTVTFDPGFGLPGGASPTPVDFVLNEGEIFDGSMMRKAQETLESIPFQLTYNPTAVAGDNASVWTIEWRPDPALYLAVMCGLFEVYIEEIDGDNGATALNIHMAIHVSGWKSIMGNPDKKRRSRQKTSSKKASSSKKGAKK